MNTNEPRIRFRKKENNYSLLSNDLVDDERLSVQARFLYVLINRSITNIEWTFYKSNLQNKMRIKDEKTFNKYWKELKDSGYLIQYKIRNEEGKFEYEYELMDSVADFEPKKTAKKSSKTTPPKNHLVEKPPSGKMGVYNNTNLNNTNLNNTNNLSIYSDGKMDLQSHDKESSEVKDILKLCQIKNFKLSKKNIKDLLHIASVGEIKTAILKATDGEIEIKKPYAYLLEIISNINKTTTAPKKALKFNNFEGRQYDYEELEKKLLGWDN